MWYLYLDESGDLGFDFVNKKPSKFFTICILASNGVQDNRQLIKAVKVTIRRKLNPKMHRKRIINELKGRDTTLDVKKYFFDQIKNVNFGLYAITLNKKRVYTRLTREKSRVYNWIARQVVDQIPFEKNAGKRVELIIDRSKSKPEIVDFNNYIRTQIQGRLDPRVRLDIYHWHSHEAHGIQAADMFSWGVFQKYERKNTKWVDVFKQKIVYEDLYLK